MNLKPFHSGRGSRAAAPPSLSYERFRAVFRFAPDLLRCERGASNFVTLLRAADAAFFKVLRFMTTDAAPTDLLLRMAPSRVGQDGVHHDDRRCERRIESSPPAGRCSDAAESRADALAGSCAAVTSYAQE